MGQQNETISIGMKSRDVIVPKVQLVLLGVELYSADLMFPEALSQVEVTLDDLDRHMLEASKAFPIKRKTSECLKS